MNRPRGPPTPIAVPGIVGRRRVLPAYDRQRWRIHAAAPRRRQASPCGASSRGPHRPARRPCRSRRTCGSRPPASRRPRDRHDSWPPFTPAEGEFTKASAWPSPGSANRASTRSSPGPIPASRHTSRSTFAEWFPASKHRSTGEGEHARGGDPHGAAPARRRAFSDHRRRRHDQAGRRPAAYPHISWRSPVSSWSSAAKALYGASASAAIDRSWATTKSCRRLLSGPAASDRRAPNARRRGCSTPT
jgi:hypothetical protein